MLEVVVVDDVSTDDSAVVVQEALRELEEQFYELAATRRSRHPSAPPVALVTQLVRNAVNVGAGVSRNAGVNASHGDVLFFCDSEDKVGVRA